MRETPTSLKSSIVALLCGLGILAEDAAIAKGSLDGMTMGKPQGDKGHVVTLEQTDTNRYSHLGGH